MRRLDDDRFAVALRNVTKVVHPGAGPTPRDQIPLGLKLAVRLHHRRARQSKVIRERATRGQPRSRGESPRADRGTKLRLERSPALLDRPCGEIDRRHRDPAPDESRRLGAPSSTYEHRPGKPDLENVESHPALNREGSQSSPNYSCPARPARDIRLLKTGRVRALLASFPAEAYGPPLQAWSSTSSVRSRSRDERGRCARGR